MAGKLIAGATGKARYTSLDVAMLAGVSQPTVSRALNGCSSVTEATRQRVIAIAQQLDYCVDSRARRLRLQQTGTLTLLVYAGADSNAPALNPFYLAMIGSITRAVEIAGYDLLLGFQHDSDDRFANYEKSRKSDGLILLGYSDEHLLGSQLSRLATHGTPFVRWGAVTAGSPGVTIGCDNIGGGRLATEHLLRCGRRQLVFLGDIDGNSHEFRDRYRGYQQAMTDAGLTAVHEHAALSDQQAGAMAVARLLQRGCPIDAIVAASDQIALSAISYMAARGMRVPDDVAVTGYDDVPLAAIMNPPLTTIRQDTALAGALLVSQLLSLSRGQPTDNHLLEPALMVRRSCGRIAVGHSTSSALTPD